VFVHPDVNAAATVGKFSTGDAAAAATATTATTETAALAAARLPTCFLKNRISFPPLVSLSPSSHSCLPSPSALPRPFFPILSLAPPTAPPGASKMRGKVGRKGRRTGGRKRSKRRITCCTFPAKRRGDPHQSVGAGDGEMRLCGNGGREG